MLIDFVHFSIMESNHMGDLAIPMSYRRDNMKIFRVILFVMAFLSLLPLSSALAGAEIHESGFEVDEIVWNDCISHDDVDMRGDFKPVNRGEPFTARDFNPNIGTTTDASIA
jgi:hypothetical protein